MLTDTKIRSLSKKGMHADGDRLYLQVSSHRGKSWIFRWKIEGKTRYSGLGSYPAVTLKAARAAAVKCNQLLAEGLDPIEEKKQAKAEKEALKNTFEVVARKCAESKRQAFRNEKHKWQWLRTLEMYAFPHIGHMKIGDIGHPNIVRLLEPIWLKKAETAKRTRQRIESVFDYAAGHGLFDRANPANIALLRDALPSRAKHLTKSKPHPALDVDRIPAFYAALAQEESMSALALRWTILAGVRTTETLGAQWVEIHRHGRVWIIPPERTKTYEEFSVPLTEVMMVLLCKMQLIRRNHPYIFYSPSKPHQPLSNAAMRKRLRKMGVPAEEASVHGFRANLKTWGLLNNYSEEVTEAALAHRYGNKVSQSYNRTDLLEVRRGMMDAYSTFVTGGAELRVSPSIPPG